MSAGRDLDAAVGWAEQVTGGTVVSTALQARWRPQLFLELRLPDGSNARMLLRGYRNPGYLGDEATTRMMLGLEAAVLGALQETPVKVPRLYGYDEEAGWILMEWVQGTEMLTLVDDPERRRGLFRDYLRTVADLHALDPDALPLPPEYPRPASSEDVVFGSYRTASRFFELARPDEPDPLLRLGRWWIETHAPAEPGAVRLCAGDIGPNQFLFEGDEVRSMFDLEIAHIGDPYEDLGLMRMREMCYPIGDLPDHLRHYATLTGDPLDLEVLRYWTVVGMITGPLWFWGTVRRPDPHLADQIAVYSFVPIYRRGLAEALMEIYDVDVDFPRRPEPVVTPRTVFHDLLAGQLEQVYLPAADDPAEEFRLRGTAALARSAALGERIGPALDRADLDELGDVLGHRPEDLVSGLAELDELIAADPEAHLDAHLRLLHRMEARREFVHEPMQDAMGFACNHPLTRLG